MSKSALSFLLVAAAGLGGSAQASAHPEPPDVAPGLPVYVALGDSIANGQQSADTVEGDYWATIAGYQANGYVAQFAADLTTELDCLPGEGDGTPPGCSELQLLNLARSAVPAMDGEPEKKGVTTSLLIEEQLPVVTQLLAARNSDSNPRNDVEMVTITVGGNDVSGPIVEACLGPDPSACADVIQDEFEAFAVNYSTILANLRAAGGPDARIMTMTYYNPAPFCDLGEQNPMAGIFYGWVLEGGVLPGPGWELPIGFNGLIRGISAQYDATVADVSVDGGLGDGDFVGGTDCLHPNKSGQDKIADVFSAAFAAAFTG